MRLRTYKPARPSRPAVAFTVTELLVAISLMSVIVFALYSVFNQTQRALRNTEAQSNVGEKGRAVLELLSREMEQMVPSLSKGEFNLISTMDSDPTVQTDFDASADVRARTNVLDSVYFLSRQTNSFVGIGYRIEGGSNGVGTLQRFSTNTLSHFKPLSNALTFAFLREPADSTNFHLISEGIIHFRLVPYDPEGRRLGFDTTNNWANYAIKRVDAGNKLISANPPAAASNYTVLLKQAKANDRSETQFTFISNALPAYVELELGVLEPDTFKQYQKLQEDQSPAAKTFLAKRIAKVHLYRQRIPIRTAAQ